MKSEYTAKRTATAVLFVIFRRFSQPRYHSERHPSCFHSAKFPLPFLAFVVGEDIRQEDSGDGFDFVLRDAAVVDQLFPPAQMVPPINSYPCDLVPARLLNILSHPSHPIKIKMQPPVKQMPVAAAYVFTISVYRRNEKLSSVWEGATFSL